MPQLAWVEPIFSAPKKATPVCSVVNIMVVIVNRQGALHCVFVPQGQIETNITTLTPCSICGKVFGLDHLKSRI
jgi:hypothetical protein